MPTNSNLASLLKKSPADTSQKSPQSQTQEDPENIEQICVMLPAYIVDYVRDYQHNHAITTGNIHFGFRDALSSIIAAHKSKNPDIPPRPDTVKQSEKKKRRKK